MITEDLDTLIAALDAPLTKLEHRIYTYLSNRPESVALETSAEIARKLNVSPMTVSRFFKKLGIEDINALRTSVRQEMYGPSSPRIGRRYEHFLRAQEIRGADVEEKVAHAAIDSAIKWRTTEEWARAVELVSNAENVSVIGFQTMQYLAQGFCMRLKYARSGVHHIDGADGVYSEIFTEQAERKVLIMIDTFRYASHGPILAKAARDNGYEIILFCDEFCDWAASLDAVTLTFPNEGDFFMPLPTGIHFALNLFYQDIIYGLGEAGRSTIERISASQDLFGNFIKD